MNRTSGQRPWSTRDPYTLLHADGSDRQLSSWAAERSAQLSAVREQRRSERRRRRSRRTSAAIARLEHNPSQLDLPSRPDAQPEPEGRGKVTAAS